MKTNRKKKALTIGNLIENCYRACGKHRAIGIIRLAAETRLIMAQGHGAIVITERDVGRFGPKGPRKNLVSQPRFSAF